MFEVLTDYLMDALIDSAKLVPFLFVIYLLMEFLEHRAGDSIPRLLGTTKKVGPLAGGLAGVVPQCGLAAASAGLYSGKVITLGTLTAVFLSSSDEMLPILISSAYPVVSILKILLVKVSIAVVSGYLVDFIFRNRIRAVGEAETSDAVAEEENGHGENIFVCALKHTAEIFFFIFIFSLILNIIIGSVGEENLSRVLNSVPVAGELAAALVGLIPNCASSVIITQLYLDGIIKSGPMFAGLLVNAGVGTMVLFRTNRNKRSSLAVIVLLYCISVIWGSLIELSGLVF